MKILIALNHPAHYYLFKYISAALKINNHQVEFVIREKDILEKLLKSEGVSYAKLCQKRDRTKSVISVMSNGLIEFIKQDINLWKFVNKFKPNIMLGTDIAITHVGKLKRISSLVFNEDEACRWGELGQVVK